MPKGEFENRDRDESSDLRGIPLAGLGELPEDISRERGDLRSYSLDTSKAQNPDMARASESRADARTTGLGSPAMDYTVRSVYDSRPTSGRDFNLWFQNTPKTAEHGAEFPGFSALRKCFSVPDGWVAVVRKVFFRCTPTNVTPTNLFNYDARIALCINGAIVDPERVPIGPGSSTGDPVQIVGIPVNDQDVFETFQIADQNQFVGVDLTGFPEEGSFTAFDVLIGFYGQFLLKTGRPAMFEPANLAGRALTANTSSARDLAGIPSNPGPSGADLVRKTRRNVPFANVPILRKPR
jgi:hypothetical protein